MKAEKLIRFAQIAAAVVSVSVLCWAVYSTISYLAAAPRFEVKKLSVSGLKRVEENQIIAKAGFDLFSSGEIYNDLYVSGIEFFWGYVLSVAVAIPFGIGVGWYKKLSYLFDPFINAMNATPRVALLPLIIIWLGIGIPSKVGIIFLGAVFPMLINARDGAKTTPQNLLNAARSFGASEWQIFKSVVFPSTVPFILTGLRLGVGRALVGVLVGELYAATAGIGFMITVAGATFQTDKVFVGILVFAITGVILTAVLDRSERRFDKWRPKVGSAT